MLKAKQSIQFEMVPGNSPAKNSYLRWIFGQSEGYSRVVLPWIPAVPVFGREVTRFLPVFSYGPFGINEPNSLLETKFRALLASDVYTSTVLLFFEERLEQS